MSMYEFCKTRYEIWDSNHYAPKRGAFEYRPTCTEKLITMLHDMYKRYVSLKHLDPELKNKDVVDELKFVCYDFYGFYWDIGDIVSPNKGIKWWTETTSPHDTEHSWSYGTVVGYCKYGEGVTLDTDIGKVHISATHVVKADVPMAVVNMLRSQMKASCPLKEATCL